MCVYLKVLPACRKTGSRSSEEHVPEDTPQGAWTSQRRQAAVTYIYGGAVLAARRVYFIS